ncbi:related to complex I intermediate-associated protein CIA84 precursor [Cephalotrichum gorgonifer]|uniref:Related to complex I intermediate-associated protein CIA84 n=1 Tax=Cephalotrichum gorgonifer TaxID=2041049 RepID=A0AAE8MR58_9PEZI|nr:related to complex I intermediate-associated protein CIA84 precursor [Cephalotrichum gorgonifer]
MRAQLARHVSRRHLVAVARCPLPQALRPRPRPTCQPHAIPVLSARPFRRTFFGIFQKPPRRIKSPEWEPGWPQVLAWRQRTVDNLRAPPREELSDAFRQLFEYKLQYRVPVNSTQAIQCLRLFNYLVENKEDEDGPGLSLHELTAARDALLLPAKDSAKHHLEFSRALYTEIQRQRQEVEEFGVPEEAVEGGAKQISESPADGDFRCYLMALTRHGASTEAASLLNEYWGRLVAHGRVFKGAKKLWVILLDGLAREGKEAELIDQMRIAESHGIQYLPLLKEIMTTFFARRNRVDETKYWFEMDTGKLRPTADTYLEMIRFAVRNESEEWVGDAFRSLIDSNPNKAHWDAILQWAVLCRGEGVEGVRHMMEVMAENNTKKEAIRPDIDTINGLIRAAIEKKDQYLAERFMALTSELGIDPNPTTYLLQIDYRIDAKDLSGARAAYREMQKTEVRDDEDLPVINKYIRALCGAPRPVLKDILETTSDLEDRIVTLDPETVVALCMTFLQNDDQYEVIDTLAVHVFHYSSEQREQIRDAFADFILDQRNSTSRVWDAYQLLGQFFPETPREARMRLMAGFFARRRADMATSVFVHMRESRNSDLHPTADDYVRALEGLGRCPDAQSLDTTHNMLKLDTNIQPSTRLSNALMLAFGASGRPRRALGVWEDISRSPEGPSYASLEIIFAVLEKKPFGDEDARRIWRNVERMELEVPPAVFASYCGALAGCGRLEEVTRLIQGMPRAQGYEPDFMTLGIIYNALPGRKLQAEFQAWALGQYPDLWAQLEKQGRRRTEGGDMGSFKISRDLRA